MADRRILSHVYHDVLRTPSSAAAFPEIRDLFLLAERRQGICQNYESLGRASYETPRIANWKKYSFPRKHRRVYVCVCVVFRRYSFFELVRRFAFYSVTIDVERLLHRRELNSNREFQLMFEDLFFFFLPLHDLLDKFEFLRKRKLDADMFR